MKVMKQPSISGGPMKRSIAVALVVAGALLAPAVAQARPMQAECLCQKFAKYMDGSKKLRIMWAQYVKHGRYYLHPSAKPVITVESDGRQLSGEFLNVAGLRGQAQTGEKLKTRIKAYVDDINADQQKACQSSPTWQKLCTAAKRCVVAAALTFYASYASDETMTFWKAERNALVACQVAAFTVLFE
jgi:hypothetical protein